MMYVSHLKHIVLYVNKTGKRKTKQNKTLLSEEIINEIFQETFPDLRGKFPHCKGPFQQSRRKDTHIKAGHCEISKQWGQKEKI